MDFFASIQSRQTVGQEESAAVAVARPARCRGLDVADPGERQNLFAISNVSEHLNILRTYLQMCVGVLLSCPLSPKCRAFKS